MNIQENIVLAPYTTFKIGGAARYFVETSSPDEILAAVQWAQAKKIEIFTLGGGSNLLISDQGFDGLVIRDIDQTIRVVGTNIYSAAGASLADFVQTATDHSLTGAEELVGIPGTVGGAVRGNAGAWGREIKNILISTKIFDGQNIRTLSNADCQFVYRGSAIKQNRWLVLSAEFALQLGQQSDIAAKAADYLEQRKKKHPIEPSAGSVFKNLIAADLDRSKVQKVLELTEEQYQVATRHGKLAVGFVVDRLGLLGYQIGGAKISQHGNILINTGAATAADVVALISFIKQQVRDKLDVELQEEIQYVGF